MKTRTMLCALWMGACGAVNAQDWNTGGNTINGTTQYLGCDAASTQPLRLRTEVNQPIEWYTNAIRRMLLSPSLPGQIVNGYGGIDLSGFLGIGQFTNAMVNPPQALLHLDDGGNQDSGWRPWMRQGTYITYASDQAYLGLKDEGQGRNHLALVWADNGLLGEPDGPDQLRFIFTRDNVGGTLAAGINGLEAGRFHPAISCNEVFFGLGHWMGTGLNPRDRLHLLNGRIRVDQLPTDPAANTLSKILVVDDSFGTDYGVVKWRDASSIGGADCDWELTANTDVVSAHLAAPPAGCPGQSDNVGIGTASPIAKLDIQKVVNSGTPIDMGVNVRMSTSALTNLGGIADVGTTNFNVGWRGNARAGSRNWALDGNAAMTSLDSTVLWSGTRVVGVRGFADGNFLTSTSNIRGVWGIGRRPQTGGGGLYSSLGYSGPSDAQLKENVAPLTDAMDKLLQVHPKSYIYKSSEFPTLGLDNATHFGVIAQELEAVFPELVHDAEQPAAVDSLGNEVYPAVQFKTVNQDGLIPWLIAGLQEQHTTIAELRAQVTSMQQDLAACCANDGTSDQRSMSGGAGASNVKHTDLFIIPNPVADLTRIRYTIATPGRTRLEVADDHGKRLEVLEEAVREVGTFEHSWNTYDLAPGTYQCILYMNDAIVVKKAVKVAR